MEIKMKKIIFLTCFLTNLSYANYTVGRPLPNMPIECGVFLYTSSAEKVPGHPDPSMPVRIDVFKENREYVFTVVDYRSTSDNTFTKYFNEELEGEFMVVDKCSAGTEKIKCIVDFTTNCSYRVNIL